MATLSGLYLTLADVAKRENAQGNVDQIIEILDDLSPAIQDAAYIECNQGTSHKTTVRTGIPTPTWRELYGGVASTRSTTRQVVDTVGMLEAMPQIDVDVVDKSKDPAAVRFSEQLPHMEGMRQEVESVLWYGDTRDYPKKFMGLAPRYNLYTRSTPDQDYSDYNVIHGGGSGSDNTSIWFITWGPMTCHMLYPQGSVGGMKHEDHKKQLVDGLDSNGKFWAYVDHYKWDVGLCVRDWRSCGRIANIDVSAMEAGSSATDLVAKMIILQERIKGANMGRSFWYMHPRVKTYLRLQMLGTYGSDNYNSNVNLTFDTVAGREVMMFGGVPIHTSDAISLAEAALSQAS